MVSIQIIVGLPNDRIFLSSLSLNSPHEKEGNLSRLFNLVLLLPKFPSSTTTIRVVLGFVDCHFEVSDRKTICYLHYTHDDYNGI